MKSVEKITICRKTLSFVELVSCKKEMNMIEVFFEPKQVVISD